MVLHGPIENMAQSARTCQNFNGMYIPMMTLLQAWGNYAQNVYYCSVLNLFQSLIILIIPKLSY